MNSVLVVLRDKNSGEARNCSTVGRTVGVCRSCATKNWGPAWSGPLAQDSHVERGHERCHWIERWKKAGLGSEFLRIDENVKQVIPGQLACLQGVPERLEAKVRCDSHGLRVVRPHPVLLILDAALLPHLIIAVGLIHRFR